ncbi:MAG: hypothetical protein O3A63_18650, partial [Proteobacteria bacterium]|nr:hypothetical protein [Pseudomonadota bacterium]
MNADQLMDKVIIELPPSLEEALAELELLRFEQQLLRAQVRDFEDQALMLDKMQQNLDGSAARIVDLEAQLRNRYERVAWLENALT